MTDVAIRERTPRARPRIMGIVNVTPDSFSDGGQFSSTEDAVAFALELVAQGADLIDVGGESTRPGAERVPVDEEIARVIPVIEALVEQGVGVSIDTMNAETARAAIDAGAEIVNDVSGGLADPEMYRLIAASGVTYIAMHWRGHLDGTSDASYHNVVRDVRYELTQRLAEMIIWGVNPRQVIIDPGLGFSKSTDDNWKLLGHLPELGTLGYPILVGASRKRFLADLIEDDAPAADRDAPSAIVSALAAQSGVWGVRVHNIVETKATLDVWVAWERGASS